MAMTADEVIDFKDALGLMSADELRAQLGDNPEEDALIQAVLDGGKAVETKGSKAQEPGNFELVDGDGNTMGTPAKDETAKPKTPPADADDEEEEEEEEDGAAATAAAATAATTAATEAAAAAAAEAAATPALTDAQLAAELAPLNLSALDVDFNAKLQALDDAKAEKLQAMMDGTIDTKEYSKADADYMRARDALQEEKRDAAGWFTQVHNFKLEALRNSGINYDKDAEKGAAFDDWLKRLGSDDKNIGKDEAWFLAQAHRKVMVEFEISPNAVAVAQKPAQNVAEGKKVSEKPGRAPKLDNIPPTLGGLPAAAEVETGDDGEFAHMEKLSGMAYERALAALTPAQKDRYESA